ncbi:hypothetical protein ACVIW2_004512 [Bradyrhizobium huanghuaihaiense]|uniref:Uncharacterized protein n=2 Tax=Bradyrhizobium TaxID=374 RepID=A0A809YYU2_9BRAD|nr:MULTISPECIES: hypothetical protein [Bradyrhizobium]KMJ95032.1 hypothetical protein CF64_34040 [Bradyrhizobium japonicum]MBP1089570.1 hypothetical protein [Bradyrhizobium japonicum]MCD9297377.1 hypothetical protein [Bradyrhizobium diazoefficiens]MCD9814745.1 hypothetical protein [Bradyrhizobium diazoefficiens]MCD9832870.1 hypothetical protein [Bradyrhizobium diazoefficiens]
MQTNALRALCYLDHVSRIAICEGLTVIELYAGGIDAILFVGGVRLPRSKGQMWGFEMCGNAE